MADARDEEAPGPRALTIDELLESDAFGWRGFGPGQGLLLFSGGLAYITMALLIFIMTFTVVDPLTAHGPPPWRCTDPADAGCAAVLAAAAAGMGTGAAPLARDMQDGDDSQLPRSFCDLSRDQYEWLDPTLTINQEYDLVCGRAYLASLLETIFFTGFMVGNAVFGGVADAYGRRATLAACAAAAAVLTALSASPLVGRGPGSDSGGSGSDAGFYIHMVLRAGAGFMCAGQALGAYVLATEGVGPVWRGAAGILVQTFYIFGELLLVVLSLSLPPWRGLTFGVAAACTCAVLVAAPLVPESPRWLLLHGRRAEALDALLWIAHWNGRRPVLECTAAGEVRILSAAPPQPSTAPRAHSGGGAGANAAHLYGNGSGEEDADETSPLVGKSAAAAKAATTTPAAGAGTSAPAAAAAASTLGASTSAAAAAAAAAAPPSVSLAAAAARHPLMRCLLLSVCFAMLTLSVSYYGVTLALGQLGGALHVNFALTAVAELPSYLAIAATADRLGRRAVIGGGTALASAALLACAVTRTGPLQVGLAMLGKLGCSGAWAMGFTYAAELFPTSLRSAALAAASLSSDAGGLITPALLFASQAAGAGPRLALGGMGLLAAATVVLVLRLPETRGMPQLDTLEEMVGWLHRAHPRRGAPPPPDHGPGTAGGPARSVSNGFGASVDSGHDNAMVVTATALVAPRLSGGGPDMVLSREQKSEVELVAVRSASRIGAP